MKLGLRRHRRISSKKGDLKETRKEKERRGVTVAEDRTTDEYEER